jgi:hypothetical protein
MEGVTFSDEVLILPIFLDCYVNVMKKGKGVLGYEMNIEGLKAVFWR